MINRTLKVSLRQYSLCVCQSVILQHFKNIFTVLQLQEKVETLEKSLSHVIREFEVERMAIVKKSGDDNKHAL